MAGRQGDPPREGSSYLLVALRRDDWIAQVVVGDPKGRCSWGTTAPRACFRAFEPGALLAPSPQFRQRAVLLEIGPRGGNVEPHLSAWGGKG